MNLVAFVPARSGSKRLPNKNILRLKGHPLLAYSIQAAFDSGIFGRVYCSSDSSDILSAARHYGAYGILCPLEYAHKDNDPDIQWITHAVKDIPRFDAFAIVRPTSPFRTGSTIIRAWDQWDRCNCMKAVEKVIQHPGKMWKIVQDGLMINYAGGYGHLGPTQDLEPLYVQNGSLEIRRSDKITGAYSIWQPFRTQGHEGFDINSEDDWILAVALIDRGLAILPKITKEPYESPL